MNAAKELQQECCGGKFSTMLSKWWLPLSVLMISLGMTYIARIQSNRQLEQRAKDRFGFQTNRVTEQIEQRMLSYEQVLRGGLALFDASHVVSRDDWKNYVHRCQVQTWFPGIQAMGFAVPVRPDEKDAFEKSIRREGFPNFSISPHHEREHYTAIKFIEPFDWRNQRAFGYDMWSNPVRRTAMNTAIETGNPAISGKITLVQETGRNDQAGFLCYVPLFDTNPPNSVQKDPAETKEVPAREKHVGWVYAAFRCADLMKGILKSGQDSLSIEIYDTTIPSPENLLYASHNTEENETTPEQLSVTLPLNVSGRDWTLRYKAAAHSLLPGETEISSVVTIAGTLISLLLFYVVASIAQRRESAMRLARKMTKELRESESYTRLILENASEAIMTVSKDGLIIDANRASRSVFQAGTSLIGTNLSERFANEDVKSLVGENSQDDDGEAGKPVVGKRVTDEFFPCRVHIDRVQVDRTSGGGQTSYVVILRDETMRAENARKLEEKNQELIQASRLSGKAEIITGVLHNVGNVLNSINVAAHLLRQRLDAAPVEHLAKASEVIDQHKDSLGDFFANDKRGQHFPGLLNQLASKFTEDQNAQLDELKELTEHIGHIKEIVSIQQSTAKGQGSTEPIEAEKLFEDALKMNLSGIRARGIELQKDYDSVPSFQTRKHDVLQILVNLIRNANQAVEMGDGHEKRIRLAITKHGDQVCFCVHDSGVGISHENMQKLFQHGFTTKEDGHGFGLHSCANTAKELGGNITVESEGEGKGATFTLALPIGTEPSKPNSGNCSASAMQTTPPIVIDNPHSPDAPCLS